MKVISLQAENVKRLKAVAIAPSDNLVEITGKNAQGKTSVLDALWWALAGKDAQQLRASIAIASAMNPKLRVIRVRDGSLLDSDSMALLAGFAEANDMQVWVETVQSGRPGAIVIEDGQVQE